jgi:hypothetical protein
MRGCGNARDARQSRRLEIVNGSKPCRPVGIGRTTSRGHSRCAVRCSLSPHPVPLPWYRFSNSRAWRVLRPRNLRRPRPSRFAGSVLATRATERGFATRSIPACGTASVPLRVQCGSTLLRTTSPRSDRARAATTLNTCPPRGEGEPFLSAANKPKFSAFHCTMRAVSTPSGEDQGEWKWREIRPWFVVPFPELWNWTSLPAGPEVP